MMNIFKTKNKKACPTGPFRRGFTLIELLVVISIISLLSSVVLASLNTARTKARDSLRIQNIRSLITAIALYQNDHNGNYPPPGGTLTSGVWETTINNDKFIIALVDGGYLPAGIKDPAGQTYYYRNNSNQYCESEGSTKAVILFYTETNPNIYIPASDFSNHRAVCLK